MSKSKKNKSDLLYIMNPNCGWCKKADPVVAALIEDGYSITTLDVSNDDARQKAQEVSKKYEIACGTPLFVDGETGNNVCGFREKDVLEKWAKGEKMPDPPARKPMPQKQDQPQQPPMPRHRMVKLEYVWLDGNEHVGVRSKTRYEVLDFGDPENPITNMEGIFTQIPEWGFDGSSTNQSEVTESDLLLRPVRLFSNPLEANNREVVSYLVLCEVFNPDGSPHKSNKRYDLREYVYGLDGDDELRVSVEQEYLIMDPIAKWPSGWGWDNKNDRGILPEDTNGSYCGVGAENVGHKWLADAHVSLCNRAGIRIAGTNAEVLKSQWEYQTSPSDVISAADGLWITRFLLGRLAEQRGLAISYAPKPFDEYNGSGAHINFSTKEMREEGGEEYFTYVCDVLKDNHKKVIDSYGADNKKRLTGKNETSKYNKFTYGVSDRTASVRIPLSTSRNWKGHLEDRRPAANMDPYSAFFAFYKVINNVEAGVLA